MAVYWCQVVDKHGSTAAVCSNETNVSVDEFLIIVKFGPVNEIQHRTNIF